jgi:hypothetical protein
MGPEFGVESGKEKRRFGVERPALARHD